MKKKEIIFTDKALKPVRPYYSQGVKTDAGKLVFISGQVGMDPEGKLVGKGDVKAQARQAIESVKAVVEAAGGTLDDVVKVTVYLRDIRDFDKVAEVRNQYFRKNPPASTLIGVSSLFHEDVLIEIDAIAVI